MKMQNAIQQIADAIRASGAGKFVVLLKHGKPRSHNGDRDGHIEIIPVLLMRQKDVQFALNMGRNEVPKWKKTHPPRLTKPDRWHIEDLSE